MAVGVYVGIGGVPKELNGVYIGVGGAVKEVQEIYVGVNGVPKLVWQNALTYTHDLTDVNTISSGVKAYGTLKGKYKVEVNGDTAHVVGTATVTGFNGTSYRYVYFPLPFPCGSGEASCLVKLYSADGTTNIASYGTEWNDCRFFDKTSVNNGSVGTIRADEPDGWSLSGDRKVEIEFDYYTLSKNVS